MGIYIDWPDELKVGKAQRLIDDHGAVPFEDHHFEDVPDGQTLVAVAENYVGGPGLTLEGFDGSTKTYQNDADFDAALVVRRQAEYDQVTDAADPRTIHLLLVASDEVEKLLRAYA
jgi:hypothetical protein